MGSEPLSERFTTQLTASLFATESAALNKHRGNVRYTTSSRAAVMEVGGADFGREQVTKPGSLGRRWRCDGRRLLWIFWCTLHWAHLAGCSQASARPPPLCDNITYDTEYSCPIFCPILDIYQCCSIVGVSLYTIDGLES